MTAAVLAAAPEAIVVTAFGHILRRPLLEAPPLGCLNLHFSLLPRWRGVSPVQHAILHGDTWTGVTIMQMDAGVDTGPILAHEAVPIAPQETAGDLLGPARGPRRRPPGAHAAPPRERTAARPRRRTTPAPSTRPS